MTQYKMTVVVPTFNSGDALYNLFDSLRAQTIGFENIEVIFVDDKSDDVRTLEILGDLESFDNVSVFYLGGNSGFPGHGRNVGLENASGEYIIFSDHDDSYNKDAFKTMYEEITSNNADLVFTNYYKLFGQEKVPEKTLFNGENVVVNSFKDDLRLFSLDPTIWTKLFRKDFLISNDIKFLEGMLGEDLELYVHSLLLSKKTVYLDDVYSYNYSIRDSESDKSTIHLRNKLIFTKMCEGYYKTYQLLETLDAIEYFDNVFKKHFVYFLTSLIKSNISDEDKKELLVTINPLLKKELLITPNLDEKIYRNLTNYLLQDNYSNAVSEINKIKKRNKYKNKIKKSVNFIFRAYNLLKR